MVKENAKKALDAGAIYSANKQWINTEANCIVPAFNNVISEGGIYKLSELRQKLVEKGEKVIIEIKTKDNTVTVPFNYAPTEIIVKEGKKPLLIPKGHHNPVAKDKQTLELLAESMLTSHWEQIVYLTFGVGYYTQLESQGPGDNQSHYLKDLFSKGKETQSTPSETPEKPEKSTEDKKVEEKEQPAKEIKDDYNYGKTDLPDRIVYVSELDVETTRWKRKKNRKCSKSRYIKKRGKKREAKAFAHQKLIQEYKDKTAAEKLAFKKRKFKQPSYEFGSIEGTILNPDKDWCKSSRKKGQPRNPNKPRLERPEKGPGLPRKPFKRSKNSQLKQYWREVDQRRIEEQLPPLKRDWKDYESSPNLLSQLWAFIKLNYPSYAGLPDVDLFALRNAGKLNDMIKEINHKFETNFKTIEPPKPPKRKTVRETKGYSLACISNGKKVYRLPHIQCMDILEMDSSFKFVPKSEWKKAKSENKASYTFELKTPEERRLEKIENVKKNKDLLIKKNIARTERAISKRHSKHPKKQYESEVAKKAKRFQV